MDMPTTAKDREGFWHRTNSSRRGALFAVLSLAIVATIWTSALANRADAANGPSVELEQCSNGSATCDASHTANWQTGSLNAANSHFSEGESVPYRSVIQGLTVGATYGVTISWKSSDSGRHTIDYVTSYDRTEVGADPCAGSVCSGSPVTLGIPSNPSLGITQASGHLSLWGGTFTPSSSTVSNTGDLCGDATCTITSNPSGYSLSGTLDTTSTTSMVVTFTASTTTAVLAWGGHIASQIDWGIGLSAGAVNGASYHMYFSELQCSDMNCNVGQKDRSMSATAVTVPGSISIRKSASVSGATAFGFTATPAPLSSFDLVDDASIDVPDATPAFRTFADIVDFTSYTITESSISLWTLTNIACTVQGANGGTQTVDGRSVVIDLREGELVDCTFSNSRDPQPAISLAKTADPSTFSVVGDVVTYTYTISNTGDSDIGPAQFTITDDRISGGTAFDCGASTKVLTVGSSFTCTHTYTISADDISAGSVKNTATAHVGQLNSAPADATVTFVPPATTTTTTTTTTPVTTTTVAETTTTIPETTTTVTATTVVDQEATTTTLPATTTIPATTTVPDTCVTIPRESTTTPSSSVAVQGTVVATAVCEIPTTVPGTIVIAGGTTTTTPQPTTTSSTRLPTTGSDTGTSRQIVLLLLALGTSLVIISRRRLASTDSDRTPR